MKQELRCLRKFFIFSGALLLFNCQTEDLAVSEHNHQEAIKLSTKSIDELLKEQKFNTAFSSLPKDGKTIKTSLEGKTVMEEEYGFTIEDHPVKIVEVDGKTSYSLYITREEIKPGIIENLLIDIDSTGQFAANIIEYIVSSNSATSFENTPKIDGIATMTPIDYDGSSSDRRACVTLFSSNCNGIPYDCGGRICGFSAQTICVGSFSPITQTPILTDPEGGGNTGSGGNSGEGGSGVPASPNIPDLSTPCGQLKNLLTSGNGTPNMQQKIISLKASINLNQEHGFSMSRTPSGAYNDNNIPSTTATAANGYNATLPIPTGVNIYAGAHTHPTFAIEMFSFADVYALYMLYKNARQDLRNQVTFMLVCEDNNGIRHVYALKVDDFDILETFINNIIASTGMTSNSPPKKFIDAVDAKLTEKFYEKDPINPERAFLRFFQQAGISNYEANADVTNWSKLSLANPASPLTSTITKTPCN